MKENNQGKVQYAYLLLIAVVTVLLCMAVLENKMVLLVKNRMENVLTASGFSGTLCDLKNMVESMTVIKREENGQIFYDFEAMYDSAAVYLDEKGMEEHIDRVLEENIRSGGLMRELIMEYSLDEVILYNQYGTNPVTAPNGVILDCPGIYLRVRLDIRGIFGKRRTVYLDKCIAVRKR